MDKIKNIQKEIKALNKIQGASAVAKAVIFGLKDFATRVKTKDKNDFIKAIKKAADILLAARPTEPLAQNAVKFLMFKLKTTKDANNGQDIMSRAIKEILEIIAHSQEKIVFFGEKIIEENDNIFTHCHSLAVEEILINAKKAGKNFAVFNTETRPLFQGHITAKNLLKTGINITMVTDTSAGFLISRYSGRGLMMDKFIIGCDAILPDGSVINKIGSYVNSLATHYEGDSVYVAGSLLKLYSQNWIKIEERPAKEIWSDAPQKLKIINFAFDLIPAKFIKYIICEAGIIKPSEAKKRAQALYPWLI